MTFVFFVLFFLLKLHVSWKKQTNKLPPGGRGIKLHVSTVCYSWIKKKVPQATYILKNFTQLKKLCSNLGLLFRKDDYCHMFSNMFSVVNNSWYVCQQEAWDSSKGLLNFIYVQRKGQMIKEKSSVLSYATWGLSLEVLIKCFLEKFQFSISKKGHEALCSLTCKIGTVLCGRK